MTGVKKAKTKKITQIKLSVTAYFTSDEADFEKQASFGIIIGAHKPPDWGGVVGKLINQAFHLEGDFPFEARLMTEREVEQYEKTQEVHAP